MSVNIIQITDTHIQADPAATFDGIDAAATLTTVLEHIRLHELPDLMLLTGDLVHDPDEPSYSRLLDLLKPMSVPIYAIPGNHDDPVVMTSVLTAPVRHEREVQLADWRILLLNSWLEGEHAGYLPETELDWLHGRLDAHPDTPTLIALHHPPVTIGSPWMDAMGLQNAGDLLAILDSQPQVAAVIWGHIHQRFESERNGVQLLGSPSTCVQFKPGSHEYCQDEQGPGYRRLSLMPDGNISSEVVRV